MRRKTLSGLMACVLALAFVAVAANYGKPKLSELNAQAAETGEKVPAQQNGLVFRLSEGSQQPSTRKETLKIASGTPLTEAEVEELYKRLPSLKKPEAKEFAFRERSLPPPRSAKTIAVAFPPIDHGAGQNQGGPLSVKPLQVVRHSPEGDVSSAPALSVAFSQAMVAVTTQEQLAKLPVPVSIKPQVSGEWRWLGTRTAVFVPEGKRFPGSTRYTVQVPAGTQSAEKGKLADGVKWQFTTATLTMKSHLPGNDPQPLKPLIFIEYDQKIKRDTLVHAISLQSGGQVYQMREATNQELAANKDVASKTKKLPADTYLVLTPAQPLPGGQTFKVTIPAGTGSDEGPLTTQRAQDFSFNTFGALKVVPGESTIGQTVALRPGQSWYIKFSNPLDQKTFSLKQVTIEPPIPHAEISCSGYWLSINGQTRGRTTYKVSFSNQLTDTFGQKLGSSPALSVHVGQAEPAMAYMRQPAVLLPDGPRSFPLQTINMTSVKLEIYSAPPEDYGSFVRNSPSELPAHAKQLFNRTVAIAAKPDSWVTTWIDLNPYLKHGVGNLILRLHNRRQRGDDTETCWVQSTQIGLTGAKDSTRVIGFASSLKDGKPLPGVQLTVTGQSSSAQTGQDGTAAIPLPAGGVDSTSMLIARKGDDSTFVTQGAWYSWQSEPGKPQLVWYTLSDRSPYRPGEEVRMKGWLRVLTPGTTGDITWSSTASTAVRYNVKDSHEAEVAHGEAPVNKFGGFDFKFKLPDNTNTGRAQVSLEDLKLTGMDSSSTSVSLLVEEFRRPEFEMAIKREDDTIPMIGKFVTLGASARYYTGGPLANAELDWRATATPGSYTPAGWSEYSFGGASSIPFWSGIRHRQTEESKILKSTTNAIGQHLLRVDFDSILPPQPMSLAVQATVHDVNRQTWSDTTTLLVHPSQLYVGVKPEAFFVEAKQPYKFDLIVTDLDGKVVPGVDVKLHLAKPESATDTDSEQTKVSESEVQDKSAQSQDKPSSLSFSPAVGGYYSLTATVTDSSGRRNQTIVRFWVQGNEQPSQHTVSAMQAELLPDKKQYNPGDTAKLMVRSPIIPAHGLLVLSRSGIISKQEFYVEKGSATLTVPVDQSYLPNFHAQVHLVGLKKSVGAGATEVDAPAFADAETNLSVSTESRHLAVALKPKDRELEPGAQTSVDIEITDSQGQRVPAAEVTIGVVDESLLSLSGYRYPDALAAFYTDHYGKAEFFDSRDSVVLDQQHATSRTRGGGGGGQGSYSDYAPGAPMLQGATNGTIGAPAPAPASASYGAAGGAGLPRTIMGKMVSSPPASLPPLPGDDSGQRAIQMRSNFDALAYFAPSVVTDNKGHASVSFKLPDNLTRYRIMAVAATDSKQFGNGDCSITARLPLMVRPSAPRFLNFGDRFELPVVLQNQTDRPLEVKVAVRSDNLDLSGERGKKVEVPANDRIEVRFPASTAEAGTASYQVVAASQTCGDAAEGKLPIWTPATTEAFATYGEMDEGAIVQPILSPSGVFTQFGAVQITTSSTAFNALTDAFLYLENYPFECSEQISSRLLAVVALKDMVAAFNPEGLGSPLKVNDRVQKDIDILAARQGSDGGVGLWQLGKDELPYVTVHVVHALIMARQKDYAVQDETLRRGLNYLRNIERHIPTTYCKPSRRSLIAYALYVRSLNGDSDTATAHRLFREAKPESSSFETLGWLLSVFSHGGSTGQADAGAIRTYLNNQAIETASTAQFGSSPQSVYGEDDYLLLHTSRRDDAVILDALIMDQPKNPLIPKVVAGLMAHRRKGRWDNTQENAFVLLALDHYFHTYEKVEPDFIAQVWLGDQSAGEQKFVGRSTDRKNIDVPMQYLADKPGEQKLVINKEGKGRLYYRIGMQYAPKDLMLKPLERGFEVERKYEPVENPADVKRNNDGSWQVKAGALVRVRLKMVAPGRRYHVALVDPLPAGFEPVNPDLQGSQHIEEKKDSPRSWWMWCFWWRPVWYDYQNLRDDRAEAFTSLLWDGTYEYTYCARATTPGTFITPPTKAEEMYAPETFGRAATDRVIVQ